MTSEGHAGKTAPVPQKKPYLNGGRWRCLSPSAVEYTSLSGVIYFISYTGTVHNSSTRVCVFQVEASAVVARGRQLLQLSGIGEN